MSKLLRIIVMTLLVSSFALPSARADGDEVTKTGHGTKGSVWKLELDREARVEVDFEVNSSAARAGHNWRVVMRHNGAVFFKGTRTANGVGDYEVERTVADFSGTDTIKIRSVDQKNGEVITASASI